MTANSLFVHFSAILTNEIAMANMALLLRESIMNRPLLAAIAGVAVLGTAAGAYVVASPGGEEEVVQQVETATPTTTATATPEALPTVPPVPTPTLAPGTVLWRWGEVTVLVSENSGISVGRTIEAPVAHPPDGGPVISLVLGESRLAIDARTGEILGDTVLDADRAAFDLVLLTLKAGEPLNIAAWPYSSTAPTTQKSGGGGGIRFWAPDPASGIAWHFGCADFVDKPGICFVEIQNTRSQLALNSETGERLGDIVAAEDAEAFERWAAAVETTAP